MNDGFDNEESGFLRRHGVSVVIAVALVAGVCVFIARAFSTDKHEVAKTKEVVINIVPIPPRVVMTPTPAPAKDEQPKKQTFIPDDNTLSPPSPHSAPPISTALAGPQDRDSLPSGPDDGTGPGMWVGANESERWQWNAYAKVMRDKIEASLRTNKITQTASFNVEILLWPDRDGRITKVKLRKSTGVASVDDAIQNQILASLQTHQSPPSDMPSPIVMRITAQRND